MKKDIESILEVDWNIPRKPYLPKVVMLATGEKMVVREASREDVPLLLEFRLGVQHELGRASCWALPRGAHYKKKPKPVFGERPVPKELYAQSLQPEIIVPDILQRESD